MTFLPPAKEHSSSFRPTATTSPVVSQMFEAAQAMAHTAGSTKEVCFDHVSSDVLLPVQPGSMAAFARFFSAASLQDRLGQHASESKLDSTKQSQPSALTSCLKTISRAQMLERQRRGIAPPIKTRSQECPPHRA